MRRIIPFIAIMVLFCACSSLDCPLNNKVYTKYKLTGNLTKLTDTLTISTTCADGSDSVLINKDVNVDSFMVPMSYTHPEDVFYFQTTNKNNVTTIDTVKITKEDRPHFESVECSPAMFHTITGITYTKNAIDSIGINNKNVTYDASKAHFHIYFKSNNN